MLALMDPRRGKDKRKKYQRGVISTGQDTHALTNDMNQIVGYRGQE